MKTYGLRPGQRLNSIDDDSTPFFETNPFYETFMPALHFMDYGTAAPGSIGDWNTTSPVGEGMGTGGGGGEELQLSTENPGVITKLNTAPTFGADPPHVPFPPILLTSPSQESQYHGAGPKKVL